MVPPGAKPRLATGRLLDRVCGRQNITSRVAFHLCRWQPFLYHFAYVEDV